MSETKKTYEELVNEAIEMIANDDDLLVDLVNELDSWDGFADTFRAYPMDEIDDICYGMKPSELIDKMTSDFCSTDDYFYFSIYGLESCDDVAELYRDNTTDEEVFDRVLENKHHLYFYNSDFEELLDEIDNYDEDEEGEEDEA